MKKYIAIIGLLALLLTGCSDAEETATTATTAPAETEATVMEMPEQIIDTKESSLTGSWTATLNKGAYAVSFYFQDHENGQEMEELFKDVQYPFEVQLELREDGSYLFDVDQGDFDAFVSSFYSIMVANGLDDCTEEQLRSRLTAARLDFLYAEVSFSQEGNWEHNDQGLVFTNWCTVQFTQDENGLHWNNTDDQDFAANLPLTFTAN